MFSSGRLSLSNLIELCRSLRHNLGAGLTLRDVFRQQARRGPAAVRPVAERISSELEQGNDLETALNQERAAFPPLFLALATVGEQTGTLPEVFHELERYYLLQQRLWRQFVAQSAWPILQFLAAIFVIAGMILILGLLADVRPGTEPFDPLGLGVGPAAAVRFLAVVFGLLALLGLGYFALTRVLQKRALVDGWLLRLPLLGPCLLALALARFCLALRLTLETALSTPRALRLTLRATGNGAFEGQSDLIEEAVRKGEDLTVALGRSSLFPEEFLNVVAVAEESGRLPEVMEQQATFYNEEASRRMTILTQAAGWGVWLVVAGLIIFVIFRIALTYLGMLDPDHPMYQIR